MAQKRSKKKQIAREGSFQVGPRFGFDTGCSRWLFITGALILVLAILYSGPMFQNKIFLSADSSNADAFAAVGDASLEDGHYPLWNPYLFAGMPTFGSSAYVKYLYPPSVLFNFLQDHLGFPPLTWLLGHLLFGGLGMAWLLNRWRLPLAAVILGAVIWILFPRIVAWGVHGHGTKLGAAMYLPWIVGWAMRVLEGRGLKAIGMTGLLLGLQFLRGHPQITYYTLLALGWLGLWITVFPVEEWGRKLAAKVRWFRLSQLVLGLALGFLVGGILLWPVHEYSGISIRGQDTAGGGGVGLDYATAWSLAPSEMGTLVLPASAGFGKATYMGMMPFTDYPNYFGLLMLALVLAAWWYGSRGWFLALGSMSLLALFVSFGNFGFGLYEFLYNYLPFFNKFRVPSMILVLPAFALSLLAARGVAAWSDSLDNTDSDNPNWPLRDPRILPGVMALMGVVILIMGMTGAIRESFVSGLQEMAAQSGKQAVDVLLKEAWYLQKASMIRIGLLLVTAAAALWASYKNRRMMAPVLPWVLLVLVAMDLGGVDQLIVHPDRGLHAVGRDSQGRGQLVSAGALLRNAPHDQDVTSGPRAEALRQAVGHDRLFPLGQYASGNFWMTDKIRSLGGYHPAKLARFEKIRSRLFHQEPAGHLANWLAGKVVVFDRALNAQDLEYLNRFGTDVSPVPGTSQPPYLYLNQSALPRARLLTQFQLVDTLPERDALEPFLDALQAGRLDYRQTVYLNQTPDPLPSQAPLPLPSPVFLKDGLDEVILQVNSPVPALLLLADMGAPGWKVQVDGQPATLLTADLVLRAVALTSGPHEVRFYYTDPSVKRGLVLTMVGGLLVLGMIFVPTLRTAMRKSKQPTEGEQQGVQ